MEFRAMMKALWRSRTGPVLVALQVAITLAVVVNVAYVVQQRLAAISRPIGADVPNLFWVVLQQYSPEYNHEVAVPADLAWLQSLPGVSHASTVTLIPQGGSTTDLPFSADPAALERGGGTPAVVYFGSAQLIETLGVKLVAGRGFSEAAVASPGKDWGEMMARWSPEIVVTKSLADTLFPNGDALGKTIHAGLVNRSATIVGIVEHFQHRPATGDLAELFRHVVFVPAIPPGPFGRYLVRTEPGRLNATMARVEQELADLQPGRYLNSMEPLTTTVDRARMGMRVSSVTFGIVALFVTAVTAVGIVGLAAFAVATRTKQLGTRRAIGATKLHILRYFLVENWIITSAGAVLGCALALAVGVNLATSYSLPRLPLFYLVAGVLAVWFIGLAAVWVPAQRAASISPATATRTV